MSTEKPMENNTYTHCKRSFKAIEGFLRRVAFNLGNTPSQTEVKIISCIPIDVTDLQLKIFELQKELEESRSHANKELPQHVNTSLIQPSILPYKDICPSCNAKQCVQPNAGLICNDGFGNDSSLSFEDPESTSKNQRSPITFLHPNASSRIGPFSSEVVTNKTEREKKLRNFFSKKKAAPKRKKQKTHVIYYAQTDTKTPFCNPSNHSLSNDMTSKDYANDASRSMPFALSHFTNAVQRQYKPQSVLNNSSNLSEFSSPVCRDMAPSSSLYSRYDTDACSCFHDQFQNIDHLMNNQVKLNLYPTYENYQNYSRNAYYDSDFYDIVPVREKPMKIRNEIEIQKKKLHKKPTVKRYQPEKERLKYRTQPTVVNYCTSPLIRHDGKRELVRSQNQRGYVPNQVAAKRVPGNPFNTHSVDFGPVYAKQVVNDKQQFIPTPNNKRDSNFYSTAKNSAECQMPLAPAGNLTLPESKTETTLNQIKSMLQTVLNEVKISSKLSKPMPKKDAIVQNGPSQGTLNGESQLTHSFTYSPYSLNPYVACCSRQMASNNCTFPSAPDRYMQQYPLLIEPQKHICSNCYRNTPVAKCVNTYHAASAATNTEQKESSKETDQLIKEIYKSIALNVESPKDNTAGGYSTRKPTVKAATNFVTVEKNKACNIVNSISEIFKNTNPKESTYTGNTDATAASKTTSNVSSTESKHHIMEVSHGKRKCSYSQNATSTTETIDGEPEQISQNVEQSEDTEESSSQTESDDSVLEVKKSGKSIDMKKEKNGILNKMFKIFKPKQRRRKKDDIEHVENESESDSDDYQTVYSYKVEAPHEQRGIHIRNRPHSKSFFVNQPQQRSRTRSPGNPRIHTKSSPYMDQEYRRYWDEKVMFNKTHRNSTETSRSRNTDRPRMRRPLYPQNYEARSALVERIKQVPLRMPGNVHLFHSVPSNRYNPRNINNGGVPPNYTENVSNYQGNSQYCLGNRQHYSENKKYPDHGQNYHESGQSYHENGRNYHQRGLNNPENGQNYRENSPKLQNKNNANYSANKGLQPHYVTSKSSGQRKTVKSAIGAAWLKRHKLGIKCTGQQWRNIVNA